MAARAPQKFVGDVLDLDGALFVALSEPGVAEEKRDGFLVPLHAVEVQAVGRDRKRRIAELRAADPFEAPHAAGVAAAEVERVARVLHRAGGARAARAKRG